MGDTPERIKDPIAVELGRRGGLKRAEVLTPEQRSASARKAGQNSAIVRLGVDTAIAQIVALIPWKKLRPIPDDLDTYFDRVWARRIPRAYEEILDAAMRGEVIPPVIVVVLDKMTRLCPSLNPDRKSTDDDGNFGVDLSALSADTLDALVSRGAKRSGPDDASV